MKLNMLLAGFFFCLLGASYYFIELDDRSQVKERRDKGYLISLESSKQWSFKNNKGELKKSEGEFFWNEKKIKIHDKKLLNILDHLAELRIIRSVKSENWKPRAESHFEIHKEDKVSLYELGELNELTGRFIIKNKSLNEFYLIEDDSVLEQLYKSFEQGQKIKYVKLLSIIKYLEWDK